MTKKSIDVHPYVHFVEVSLLFKFSENLDLTSLKFRDYTKHEKSYVNVASYYSIDKEKKALSLNSPPNLSRFHLVFKDGSRNQKSLLAVWNRHQACKRKKVAII